MRDRRAVVEVAKSSAMRMALWVGVVAIAMFALGYSVGFWNAARKAAAMVLEAK
jgi:hypothetical protein